MCEYLVFFISLVFILYYVEIRKKPPEKGGQSALR